ncbi:MAG TPA: hypothetical protein PK264_14540, partial [Hyphomicrobiaceae bacterium]|nr:hypothetical protein [Hyphomicrobiaceae bacterium]
WSLVWFLVGGWVSTVAQILVIVGVIFLYKYGWQRAPLEIWSRSRNLARFVWAWARQRELPAAENRRGEAARDVVRVVKVKEFGDVNLSTLLSLVMIGGIVLLSTGF